MYKSEEVGEEGGGGGGGREGRRAAQHALAAKTLEGKSLNVCMNEQGDGRRNMITG